MIQSDDEESDHEVSQRQRAQDTVRGSLTEYQEHFWPIYREFGLTFAEGYAAFQVDVPIDFSTGVIDDDESEAWKRG